MIKKLIVLLAVLAALWAAPPARARIVLIAQPALERLGPLGDRLLTPARTYATRTDISSLLRLLAIDRNEGRALPGERDFASWAKRKSGDEPVDRWGTQFWIRPQPRSYTIGSSGPDRVRGTPDDIQQTLSF